MTPKQRYNKLTSARRRMHRDNRTAALSALAMGCDNRIVLNLVERVINPPLIVDPHWGPTV